MTIQELLLLEKVGTQRELSSFFDEKRNFSISKFKAKFFNKNNPEARKSFLREFLRSIDAAVARTQRKEKKENLEDDDIIMLSPSDKDKKDVFYQDLKKVRKNIEILLRNSGPERFKKAWQKFEKETSEDFSKAGFSHVKEKEHKSQVFKGRTEKLINTLKEKEMPSPENIVSNIKNYFLDNSKENINFNKTDLAFKKGDKEVLLEVKKANPKNFFRFGELITLRNKSAYNKYIEGMLKEGFKTEEATMRYNKLIDYLINSRDFRKSLTQKIFKDLSTEKNAFIKIGTNSENFIITKLNEKNVAIRLSLGKRMRASSESNLLYHPVSRIIIELKIKNNAEKFSIKNKDFTNEWTIVKNLNDFINEVTNV